MNIELDHFFILTDEPKKTGDLLVSMGIEESFKRDHKGQGTSNRRFELSNSMLEILYVRDDAEANTGPAKNMRFPQRVNKATASPFGVILTRTENSSLEMPFSGWKYQPDYFEPPMAFHVGSNSEILEEPLCIYAPFVEPINRKVEKGTFKSVSNVRVVVPVKSISQTLLSLTSVDRLKIDQGDEHLMEVTFDGGSCGLSRDLRPILPLIINW